MVPSLLAERIIGVTDPQDDTLVIWGIVREGEPPKQVRARQPNVYPPAAAASPAIACILHTAAADQVLRS